MVGSQGTLGSIIMSEIVAAASTKKVEALGEKPTPGSHLAANNKHHILLMEGQINVRRTLTTLLQDLFVVHSAETIDSALSVLKAHPVSVLLADEGVTKGGSDFLFKMAALSPATRVLLTGYDEVDSVVGALNRGQIYAYVAKPWSPMELRLTLNQAAAHYDMIRKLRLEQQLLGQLLEHSPDVIYFKDEKQRFTRVNKATAALVGISEPERLVGKGDWDFFSPDEAGRITAEDEKVIVDQAPVMDQLHQFTPPDGRMRWFSTTKVPLDLEVGGGLVGISRDITDRKNAEDKLQLVSQQLVEAEKDKKAFYTQVVRAVTGGKLNLVDLEDIPPLEEISMSFSLDKPENYGILRERLRELAGQAGFSEDQVEDLILATGEGVTNAINHAVNGVCEASISEHGITVRVCDQGQGIHSDDLPKTLFLTGFSTKISLGLGYTLLLQLVDCIWLTTGPEGTVLQLYKQKSGRDAEEEALLALLDRF